MVYHKVTNQIINIIKAKNVWFETFEHEPVKTSEEASKLRTGYTLDQGAKAMIVRIKISEQNKRFVKLVLPDNLKFDNNKVKNVFAAKDLRLATEQEVSEITEGVQIGGVPPFGNLFNIEVIVDSKLLKNEKIVFNAGNRKFSIGMFSSDYLELVRPRVMDFTI